MSVICRNRPVSFRVLDAWAIEVASVSIILGNADKYIHVAGACSVTCAGAAKASETATVMRINSAVNVCILAE